MAATGDDSARGEALREEAAAWLARLRGPSTADDHAAFEAWYGAAPAHAEAYDAVLRSWEKAGLAGVTPAGQARTLLSEGRVRRRRYAIAAVAAGIAILLLAFGASGARFMTPDSVRPIEFASNAGVIRAIDLADGSRITLDAASAVQTAYSKSERRVVLLRGRARFTVAHNQARPFVVATTVGLVIAHGTVFDVAFDGNRATVSLLQGSVKIRPLGTTGKAATPRMLTPGQSAIVAAGEIQTPVRTGRDTDWPNGMLSFENAPLGQVIAAANRSGSVTIVLADPPLAKLRFTGTFKTIDSEQLAHLIATTFKLDLSQGKGGTLVLSQPRASETPTGKKLPG